jgi:hypothetical protein
MSNIPRYQEKYDEIYLALFCYQFIPQEYIPAMSSLDPEPRVILQKARLPQSK